MNLSEEEKSIILHTCGLENSNKQCRNYYCGISTSKSLLALVEKGLMYGPIYSSYLPEGYSYFHLTKQGLKTAKSLKALNRRSSSVLDKLKQINKILSKMTPEEVKALMDRHEVENPGQYAILERALMSRYDKS